MDPSLMNPRCASERSDGWRTKTPLIRAASKREAILPNSGSTVIGRMAEALHWNEPSGFTLGTMVIHPSFMTSGTSPNSRLSPMRRTTTSRHRESSGPAAVTSFQKSTSSKS